MKTTREKNGGLREGVLSITRKSAKLETIINELSLKNIDYVSRKALSAMLIELGWARYNTGKMRLWIAPGETIISAGIRMPDNIKYLIGQFLNTLLADVDEIAHADLSAAVINKFNDANDIVTATIELMQLKQAKGEWYLDKHENPRTWKRKVNASKGEL